MVQANKNIVVNKKIIELNEANFDQEVLNASEPVLVEFWAGWSEPCKARVPMLESMAGDNCGPIKVARVNVEDYEMLTERYGVRAVPTLLLFKQGSLQEQFVGSTTEQAVREKLKSLTSKFVQRNPRPHETPELGTP